MKQVAGSCACCSKMPKAASQTAGRVDEAGITGGGRIDSAPEWRRRDLHIMDPRGHGSDLAQPALRVGWRDIRPAGQARHEDARVPVRFAAVRVSGYRLGRRKPGVMNGTKCRGLVPDQRRLVAVCEGEDPGSCWRRTSTSR